MRTLFTSTICILLTLQSMAQSDFSKAWKKVDSLQNLGQLQTARDEVMKIYHLSKAQNQEDQLIKALLYKIRLEGQYLEDNTREAIAFTENEQVNSKTPVKQILCSILAGIYSDYYRQNRWMIDRRTPLAESSSPDLTTWDADRFSEITTRYHLLALTGADTLKGIPLARYQAILEGDEKSRKFRPTLFDFLAFRAIDYFSGEKPGAIKPSAVFRPDNPHYFAPLATFLDIPLPEGEAESFEFQAFRLYQELLRFRSGDAQNAEALVDADLARLAWAHRKSTLPGKDSLYTEALQGLISKWDKNPVSAEVIYQLATQLRSEGNNYDPREFGSSSLEIQGSPRMGGTMCYSVSWHRRGPQLRHPG